MIDHVYVKKTLMEEFFTNLTVGNSYFSDHDAVRIVIEKNSVDFQINPKKLILPDRKEKNVFYFGSMLPKWKTPAPELKIFLQY